MSSKRLGILIYARVTGRSVVPVCHMCRHHHHQWRKIIRKMLKVQSSRVFTTWKCIACDEKVPLTNRGDTLKDHIKVSLPLWWFIKNDVHRRHRPSKHNTSSHLRARNGTSHANQNKDEKRNERKVKNNKRHATSEALFRGTHILDSNLRPVFSMEIAVFTMGFIRHWHWTA